MHIAVDIDGILTFETEGFGDEAYKNRTPNMKNISIVNNLHQEGHRILLFTARHEEDREVTIDWLTKHDITYDELIMGKPHYDVFVDDRAQADFSLPVEETNK